MSDLSILEAVMPVSPTDHEEKLDVNDTEESSPSENEGVENTENSPISDESDSTMTTLDAINKALEGDSKEEDEQKEKGEETSDEEQDESKDESGSEDKQDDEEMSEEELNALKHKTRKRIEQLQGRYRDARTENEELKGKLEAAETDAGYYRQYTQFLESNGINQEEANQLFNIGAMMKNDPVRALEALTPYYNQLLQITGNVLPNDLQDQVKQGYITEDHALALSRERAINRNNQVHRQIQEQRQQEQISRRQQQVNSDIQAALAGLDQRWKADPNYNAISARVQERVKLMWYEAASTGRMPGTVQEAVQMVEQAKRTVEEEFRSFAPKRKPVSAPVDNGNVPNSKPEPKSTLDVINRLTGG